MHTVQTRVKLKTDSPKLSPSRRSMVLFFAATAASLVIPRHSFAAAPPPPDPSALAETNAFVSKLLAKSTDPQTVERRKQERLEDNYKRNFGDYFAFQQGGKTPRTENEIAIRAFLDSIQ